MLMFEPTTDGTGFAPTSRLHRTTDCLRCSAPHGAGTGGRDGEAGAPAAPASSFFVGTGQVRWIEGVAQPSVLVAGRACFSACPGADSADESAESGSSLR